MSAFPIYGLNTKGHSKWLEPILHNWALAQDRYDRAHQYEGKEFLGDFLLMYNERPCVGTLAAATWLAGGYALEEYGIVKRGSKDLRTRALGRCDLYVGLGDQGAQIEAKHKWIEAGAIVRHGRDLENHCLRAGPDAKRTIQEVQVYGATFLGFRSSPKIADDPHTIPKLIQAIKNIRCEAKAWYFPTLENEDLDGKRYFGAALILKEAFV